jgi:hypothetical protein
MMRSARIGGPILINRSVSNLGVGAVEGSKFV